MSRLKPPKIVALRKRPTQIPQPPPPAAAASLSSGAPALAKKSCLKPASVLVGPSSSSSGSSTASSSSSSSPLGCAVSAAPGKAPQSIGPPRPTKSVQIKTSHNLVKLVRNNSGTGHAARQSRDSSITSTFRELFRDFPANATASVSVLGGGGGGSSSSAGSKVNAKPPPYRNPPQPPPTPSSTGSLKRPVKRTEVDSYDEIEIDTGHHNQHHHQSTLGRKSAPSWKEKDKDRRSTLTGTLPRKAPPNNYVIFKEIRTKAEVTATQDQCMQATTTYTSDRFQNIPVKARKSGGAMQRLENYCLFDPSVDFISEKDEPAAGQVGYSGGGSLSASSAPGLRNYEYIEQGPSSFIAETDLYILDSLTDAMYGQSMGLSGLEKGTPSLPSTRSSSGVSTPVGLGVGLTSQQQLTGPAGSNDRYIQVINHHRCWRKLELWPNWVAQWILAIWRRITCVWGVVERLGSNYILHAERRIFGVDGGR